MILDASIDPGTFFKMVQRMDLRTLFDFEFALVAKLTSDTYKNIFHPAER